MRNLKPSLYTIGYQGRTREGFLAALVDNSVQVLLDVRLRPQSRRPGFSKSTLSEACRAAGIRYEHDRGLGTPRDIMDTFRNTGFYDWDAYVAHLHAQPEIFDGALEIASEYSTCLVCFEADPAECHRRFVASRLITTLDLRHTDL